MTLPSPEWTGCGDNTEALFWGEIKRQRTITSSGTYIKNYSKQEVLSEKRNERKNTNWNKHKLNTAPKVFHWREYLFLKGQFSEV